MNDFIALCLTVLAKLPVERLFVRKRDPMEPVKKLEAALTTQQSLSSPNAQADARPALGENSGSSPEKAPSSRRVTTEETIAYQKRELGKELLLLEKHLQQRCKIGGVACDCCEKHPIVIEALAQESLGMSTEPVFNDIIIWVRKIAPMTTEAASQSGKYDDKYPAMAIKARGMRKKIMGTEEIGALLSPELDEKVSSQVEEIIARTLKKEGGKSDD